MGVLMLLPSKHVRIRCVVQPEELSKAKFMDSNGKSSCGKKGIPEEMILGKELHMKKTLSDNSQC